MAAAQAEQLPEARLQPGESRGGGRVRVQAEEVKEAGWILRHIKGLRMLAQCKYSVFHQLADVGWIGFAVCQILLKQMGSGASGQKWLSN